MHPPVANFLLYIYAKNYENWMTVDKVITKIVRLTFFGPPCISNHNVTLTEFLQNGAAFLHK